MKNIPEKPSDFLLLRALTAHFSVMDSLQEAWKYQTVAWQRSEISLVDC